MTVEEKQHSPIGASSCERWWNCPGSVKLIDSLPPAPSSQYAAEGTVAHWVAEQWLNSGVWQDDEIRHKYVGTTMVQDGFEIEITDEMVDAVEVYKNAVWEYVFGSRHGEKGLDGLRAGDIRTEVKFALTHIDPEAFGTCDLVIVKPMDRIIVMDYKHGKGHAVEVTENKQLLYYALGALYELPPEERDFGYVETVIVQPRAKHPDGPIRKHVYRLSELREFGYGLKEAVERVRKGDDTPKAGAWCKFCNAKPVCPAVRKDIQERAALDFDCVEEKPVQLPEPSTLQPERLAQLLRNAETIRGWCDSVAGLAFQLAEHGTQIPGYKLVQKTGNRKWQNEADVLAAFELEFGDDIFNKKLKSPAQMEKLLKKRKAEIEPYVVIPVTGKSLVPEEDARTGVGTAADFDEWVN